MAKALSRRSQRVKRASGRMRVHETIRHELRLAGMTHKDLAQALGKDRSVVTKMLKGEVKIDADIVPDIVSAIGTTLGRIYGQPSVRPSARTG